VQRTIRVSLGGNAFYVGCAVWALNWRGERERACGVHVGVRVGTKGEVRKEAGLRGDSVFVGSGTQEGSRWSRKKGVGTDWQVTYGRDDS
jgi:hypothetical protein